jgi:hypothetical protein
VILILEEGKKMGMIITAHHHLEVEELKLDFYLLVKILQMIQILFLLVLVVLLI